MESQNVRIIQVNPRIEKQIRDALLVEKNGFTGGDPPESDPRAIRYLVKRGWVFLLYVGRRPASVIELLPFEAMGRGVKVNPKSPLAIINANRQRVFGGSALRPSDAHFVYHHGIATLPEFREGGYAKMLLYHALNAVKKRAVVCFVEAGFRRRGVIAWAVNEFSLNLHLAAGFRVTALVEPPVYDGQGVYFVCVKESA